MKRSKYKKPVFNYRVQNRLIELYSRDSKTPYYAVIAGYIQLLIDKEWLFDEVINFMHQAVSALNLRTGNISEHEIIYNSEVLYNAAIAVYRFNINFSQWPY